VATAVNSFEGGTDDTTVTTGNSGGASGTAFESVTVGGSSVGKFENSQFAHGGLSFEFSTGGVSESSFVSWVASFGTQTTVYTRFYIRLSAAPGSSASVLSTLSGATARCRLQVTTASKLRVLDAAGATVSTSTAGLSNGVWYRVECMFVMSATVGQSEVKFYARDSASAIETNTSAANQNFGGSADRIRFGCVANQTSYPQTWMDNVGFDTAGYMGAVTDSYGGTVTPAGAPQKQTGKALAGSAAPAGAVVKSLARALAGSAAPAGAAVKSLARALAGAVSPAGAVTKLLSMPTAGAVVPAGSVVKQCSKPLAGAVAPGGALTKAYTVTFAGAVAATGAVVKVLAKTLAGSVAAVGALSADLQAGAPAVPGVSLGTLTAGRTSAVAVSAGRTSTAAASAGRSSAPTISGG
jgi:hypothetical protein